MMKSKSTKKVRAIDTIIKFQNDDGIESLTISGKDVLADVSIDSKSNVTLFMNADPDKINEIKSEIPFVNIETLESGTETDKKKSVTLSQDLRRFAIEIGENSKELAEIIKSQSSIVISLSGLSKKLTDISNKLLELETKNIEQDSRLNENDVRNNEQDTKLTILETGQQQQAEKLTNLPIISGFFTIKTDILLNKYRIKPLENSIIILDLYVDVNGENVYNFINSTIISSETSRHSLGFGVVWTFDNDNIILLENMTNAPIYIKGYILKNVDVNVLDEVDEEL